MADEARETSGATTLLLLGHVEEQGGRAAVEEVLRRAGTTLTAKQLRDPSSWIGYDLRIRLFRAATEVLDDPTTMRQVGAAAVHHGAHHALVLVLRGLGSPRAVFRVLHRAVAKFTTTSTMQVLGTTRTSAELDYRLHEGFEHSRLDCEYAQGLFEAIPTMFGLPPGRVEHAQCQSDGFPSCRYRVTWTGRRGRLAGRVPVTERDVELRALRGQMEELQLAASDLVGSTDVGEALDRIVERAAGAVLAPAYLLVVGGEDGRPPTVRSRGLSAHREAELARRLLEGSVRDPSVAVVDVASQRRHHGLLAVVYGPEHAPMPEERALLEAYSRHAAAALDLLTALETTRTESERATALLRLAQDLASAEDEHAVAEVLAEALPVVVGCRSASVMLWEAGRLRVVAAAGQAPDRRAALLGTVMPEDASPELSRLLTRREVLVVDPETATPLIADVLRSIGASVTLVAPIVAGETMLGLVTASWSEPVTRGDLDAEVTVRATSVAAQAATALSKARLLGTVRHQAHHDALTGLPNRVLFTRHLDGTLREARPAEGTAVLFCDLDRFKAVNDDHGHAAGDELLRQVAARLRGVFRPGDVVGRLSGDEFAVVLADVDEATALAVAGRVVEALDQPFRVEGREQRVTVSVGVALHEGTDGRGDRLLAAADAAMYEAKQRGRNQVAVAGRIPGRLVVPSLEAELGHAVENGQLRLYFQPIVQVSGGETVVVGAEALLRWAHPRLGLLAPGAFLPLAEESGLVADLDLWAIDAACAALAGWPAPADDAPPLHVAVNLAGATLIDERLAGTVRAALTRHDVAAERLHLEVVESRTLADVPRIVEHLAELRRMGLRIALDDFGTGFSTLAWLQALPVDSVKIDRSFVRRLPDDAASLAVVRGVVALAAELSVDVVAEGVERADQLELLREAGCRHVQGYLLGRPAPLLETTVSVDRGTVDARL
nr:EAL domain-containing protein [uncultured Actinotalea sp.]